MKMIKCNISKKCGSCQLIDKEYNETLKIKLNYVNSLFKQNKLSLTLSNPHLIKQRAEARF